MYNFFTVKENRKGNFYYIDGADYNHIKNVLRMNKGEVFYVNCEGNTALCRLKGYEDGCAVAEITDENCRSAELPNKIYLFQALPKGDKMELIIQKCTELGVFSVIPVEMKRCVVKLDDKKKKNKTARWQAVAESAAKQSNRNVIPTIGDVMNFEDALAYAKSLDVFMVPYENARGTKATKEALNKIKTGSSVGILIGPEGGFEKQEIEEAQKAGITISLGKRILRTETAAITAVGMTMLHIEMNVTGENE